MVGNSVMNYVLTVIVHAAMAAVLVVYLPVASVCRLVRWVVVMPLLSMRDAARLEGKVVLITGASSGIGEDQVAYEYARRRASLAIVARRKEALQSVAARALSLGAADVLVVPADVSVPEESRRMIEQAVDHFGRLDHLVANAGIWSTCLFEEVTNIAAFTNLMDVNFWGAVYSAYYALPHLKASKGSIIATSSIAGRVPTARMSIYNASKAAVIRFFETLRSELGGDVHITILMPGYVESELTKGKGLQKGGEMAVDEEARDIQIGPFPVGHAEDLARVAVDGVCCREWYVTWPSWYKPFHFLMCFAPELVNLFSQSFYIAADAAPESDGKRSEKSTALSKRILMATGAKKVLYPASIREAAAGEKKVHY